MNMLLHQIRVSVCLAIVVLSTGCQEEKMAAMPYTSLSFSPDGKWLVAAGGTVKPRGGEGKARVWQTSSWKVHDSWLDGFTDKVDAVFFISVDTTAVISKKMIREREGSAFDGILVRLWNVPDKKELASVHLKGARGWGRSIGFHAPDKLIAFTPGDYDKVGIYKFPSLEERTLLTGHSRGAFLLRFSPDGKRILSAIRSAEDPQIRLYDNTSGQNKAVFKLAASHDETSPTEVRSADYSANGKMIAIGTIDPIKIYVLTADLSATLLTLEPGLFPDCVKFTPDSELVAIKNGRNTVQLYSTKTKEPRKTFDGNPEGVNGWCFSPDGAWIAIASGGHPDKNGGTSPGRVRVFEVKTGKLVAELE